VTIQIASHREAPIPAPAVRELYDEEGWWPERSTTDIEAVLESGPAVGAWDGQQLVGFARAVTDGRFRAYAEDVTVRASHRGSRCSVRLLDHLHSELSPVELVSLFCHKDVVALYREAGYAFTEQEVGHWRRPS
jgi:hypothetical protein